MVCWRLTWRNQPWQQACKLKCRLRELISCLCSAAALAVCFEGRLAGLDPTETGNEISQPKFQFTGLPGKDDVLEVILKIIRHRLHPRFTVDQYNYLCQDKELVATTSNALPIHLMDHRIMVQFG